MNRCLVTNSVFALGAFALAWCGGLSTRTFAAALLPNQEGLKSEKDIYHAGWIDFNKNGKKDVFEDPQGELSAVGEFFRERFARRDVESRARHACGRGRGAGGKGDRLSHPSGRPRRRLRLQRNLRQPCAPPPRSRLSIPSGFGKNQLNEQTSPTAPGGHQTGASAVCSRAIRVTPRRPPRPSPA